MSEVKAAEKESKKARTTRVPQQNENGPYVLVEDLVNANTATMEAFVRAGEAVLKGMVSLNEEVMSFADKRMRAQIDTSQSLAKCSTFAEAMELQSEFARSATEDYLEEANKLLSLSAEVTKEGMVPWEAHAKEAASRFGKPAA
ncbi:MAG: phasin family protein [Alphaproteobacteria bacterium]|nr:phasin family protein [Alphaproteobacteria bacterium]